MTRAKLQRRDVLKLTGAGALLACNGALPPTAAPVATTTRRVRLASVPTAVEGGILPALLADFEKTSGLGVDLIVHTKDVYDLARAGECDLILSHYGHKQAEAFVMDGWGEWPRTVFSNQSAILGPKDDPAGIRGMDDAITAFGRIAAARAPFVVNDLDGQRYVAEILWNGAGRPPRDGWWIDPKANRDDALAIAAERRGYVMWGLTPFESSQQREEHRDRPLEPLVYSDPLLQRLMVTIIVRRDKVASANADGAHALQSFLLAAPTQAKMRTIAYPGVARSAWAPAGRNNRYAILPLTRS
jgi:tungstate transport system substrate-binding protein